MASFFFTGEQTNVANQIEDKKVETYTPKTLSQTSQDKNYEEEYSKEFLSPYYVVPFFAVILLIIFLSVLGLYIYTNSRSLQVSTGTREIASGRVKFQCPIGQCATNMFTGEKECPVDISSTEQVTYNPVIQVCNGRSTCDSPTTPFALQPDGSTRSDGICADNSQCRCLRDQRCSSNTLVKFKTRTGNTFQSLDGTYTSLDQIYEGEPPYTLTSDNSEFCSIPGTWLSRTYPRVDMSFPRCVRGTLSFLAENSSDFDLIKAQSTPLACMRAPVCEKSTEVSVWDDRINSNVCVELCPHPLCITGDEPECEAPRFDHQSNSFECVRINT